MLLLLLLAHRIPRALTVATGEHPLDLRGSDSCNDINNCRQLFDIVWGCLTTIFASTWVSVHPNVPPPGRSQITLLLRRLRMMFIAVMAPELVVGFAARQFLVSRALSKEFKFSPTHALFFSMGGFVTRTGHPITTTAQLTGSDFGKQYLEDIARVDVEDIRDKSKGDGLSKGVALAQGLWFTVQCLARLHQHLPLTELEVATLAFAVVNVFIWLLWWNKPLDVQRPIAIGPDLDIVEGPQQKTHMGLKYRVFGVLTGDYEDDPILFTSVPTFWSAEEDRTDRSFQNAILIECLVGTLFGAIHCAAWHASFPTRMEMWMWRACALVVIAFPTAMFCALGFMWSAPSDDSMQATIGDFLGGVFFVSGTPTYTIARLFLIALPFTTLRVLPGNAFVDVDWSVYIPHL
ncbi:hypothetical protein C8R46DRAFT_923945 [Mycena filopes]|nr:hypothetical protein C8R46DRAFT_923945 [Mycena filopes]